MYRAQSMVLVIVLFFGISFSQIIEKNLQLDRLINIALTHNPDINARKNIVISKTKDILPAGSLPDPMVTGGYFISPVVTKEGPQEWRLGITQNFPWAGKLSGKEKIAGLQLSQEQEQLRRTTLSVMRDVRSIYEQLKLLASAEAVTRENLEILSQLESVVRLKYTTATASQSYLLKIQMEMIKLEDDLTSIQNKRPVLMEKLTLALGIAVSADLLLFIDLLNFEKELSAVDSSGFTHNPQLKIANIGVDENLEKVHLAKLASRPDFAAGMDYIALRDGTGDNPLMIRGGISVPIWFKKNKALREASEAMLDGARFRVDDITLSLTSRFEQIQFDLEDSHRKYQLYTRDLLPLAEQNYTVAKSAYLSDDIDFETYLNAEENLLTIKLMCATLRARYYTARAEYLNLTAQEF